jgi:hypothetical protein
LESRVLTITLWTHTRNNDNTLSLKIANQFCRPPWIRTRGSLTGRVIHYTSGLPTPCTLSTDRRYVGSPVEFATSLGQQKVE